MIGDGVNDVPALKQARLAVGMGSGSQITKGIADIVLIRDQFSMLPRAVAEGRRIARNLHRLGRLYATKTVYAGMWEFRRKPDFFTSGGAKSGLYRSTDGIPSFVLALAPSEGHCRRGRLLRALAAFAVPAGLRDRRRLAALLLHGRQDLRRIAGRGRTAATTTLIVLGLCFILLLERGPGREHITIQSYMLALVACLGALYALVPPGPCAVLRPRAALGRAVVPEPAVGGGRAGGGRLRLAAALHPGARGAGRDAIRRWAGPRGGARQRMSRPPRPPRSPKTGPKV
jgi:hypothetical protein